MVADKSRMIADLVRHAGVYWLADLIIPLHLATQQNSDILVAIPKDLTHPSLRFYNLSSNEAQGSAESAGYEVDDRVMAPFYPSAHPTE